MLRDFLQSGKISDAIGILRTCKENKIPKVGVELGKFFRSIFQHQADLLLQMSYCAFDAEEYELFFDITYAVRDMNISDQILKQLSHNASVSIPKVADRYIGYNSEIVQKILNKVPNPLPMVTLTITSCKRYDLFEKTVNSFLNCCTDLDRIDKWLCVDDNSSEEDRKKMQEKYPFFEFYFKTLAEKGHPQSMNIIRTKVTTPYIFHMEDDWKFIVKKNYITLCMDVISQSDKIGQCLINKNYGETEKDYKTIGGIQNQTNIGTRFYIHEYCPTQEAYEKFYIKYGNGPNSAYWKHFSFRPSLLKKHIINDLGPYNEKISHFEAEYSDRYIRAGYVSAFLDGIYSLHIGRLTSEQFDDTKPNAYVLNSEKQFSGKEQSLQSNTTVNIKTYVVNLDRRPDRWESFTKQAPKFLDYHRFSAVDGSKLIPNDQLQRIFEGNDYNMREGMVGCAMSHLKMWIELINSPFEAFCIFEDDLEFVPNFLEKFLHVYKNLPNDWDLCYLGHHLWKQFKTPDYFDKQAMPILEKWNTEQSLKYSIGGTGGYIISKKGANKLLEFINKSGMTNGIDTMQQKSADILNIYYCKPHLIYSECWLPGKNIDTDIQYSFKSLDMASPGNIQKYPERLKKNGLFNIDDALKYKKVYLIPCSETTHTFEAIKSFRSQDINLPFDSTDGGTMNNFAEIISRVCTSSNNEDLMRCANELISNKHGIVFPHENSTRIDIYKQKIHNLFKIITDKNPIAIVHVSRWKKTQPKIFENLADLLLKFNSQNRIITVNGLSKDAIIDEKYKGIIVPKYLDFPEKYQNDSWDDIEKIKYDQQTFRLDLIPLLINTVAELQI